MSFTKEEIDQICEAILSSNLPVKDFKEDPFLQYMDFKKITRKNIMMKIRLEYDTYAKPEPLFIQVDVDSNNNLIGYYRSGNEYFRFEIA